MGDKEKGFRFRKLLGLDLAFCPAAAEFRKQTSNFKLLTNNIENNCNFNRPGIPADWYE